MNKKCIKCGKKRGTRKCKPLGGYICAQCCGENRGIIINCPSDCPYFQNHEKYQEEKLVIENEKGYLERYANYINEDNLVSLNFLRRKASPIFIPEMSKLSMEEYLWNDVKEFLKEKRGEGETFSSEEIIEVIENIIKFISSFKDKKGNKRGYIRFLNGYMRKTERKISKKQS